MPLSFLVAAFLIGLPFILILVLTAMRVLDPGRDRHALRLWGLRPGVEVVRRRGRWCWRTAA